MIVDTATQYTHDRSHLTIRSKISLSSTHESLNPGVSTRTTRLVAWPGQEMAIGVTSFVQASKLWPIGTVTASCLAAALMNYG